MSEEEPRALALSKSLGDYTTRRMTASLQRRLSHYDFLELEPNCTTAQIRKAYYHFARIFHPDKCQDPAAEPLLNDIQIAYDILSDEYKRTLYDMNNGFRSEKELAERLSRLSEGLRQRYQHFLQDRNEAYIASMQHEYERKGLVIKRALYGDLSLTDPSRLTAAETIGTQHLRGPFIEVTVQLQVLIEHGVLHINAAGPMSYAFLPGFYNPLDFVPRKHEPGYDDETQLYILYLFKGDVHEVTICDGKPFTLPMRSHRVYGPYIKGPYAMANLEAMESR